VSGGLKEKKPSNSAFPGRHSSLFTQEGLRRKRKVGRSFGGGKPSLNYAEENDAPDSRMGKRGKTERERRRPHAIDRLQDRSVEGATPNYRHFREKKNSGISRKKKEGGEG